MTGDRPTTPGWHCHRCRSTSCRQRADSDTDHVGRVEYRPLLLTQPSSVSWLWSHTHWCPSQRPQEVMRVDGSANPTMPKNPAQYGVATERFCYEIVFTRRNCKLTQEDRDGFIAYSLFGFSEYSTVYGGFTVSSNSITNSDRLVPFHCGTARVTKP